MSTNPSNNGNSDEKPSLSVQLAMPRRLLAVAVLVVLVVSATWAPRQECGDEIVANESGHEATYLKENAAVQVCKDAGATGLYAIAAFALTLTLLSPDFAEISFGGLTLRAKVREQDRQIARQEQKQEKLEATLADINIKMLQTVNNNVIVSLSAGEATALAQRLPIQAPKGPTGGDGPPNDAVARKYLIDYAEQLTELRNRLGLSPYIPPGWTREQTLEAYDVVRRARNNVAHAIPIQEEDVQAALRLAVQLLIPIWNRSTQPS